MQNQPKRLDFDNTINLSSLIVSLGKRVMIKTGGSSRRELLLLFLLLLLLLLHLHVRKHVFTCSLVL
jgi:hypothetical protein